MTGIEIVKFYREKLINLDSASLWDKVKVRNIYTETYMGKVLTV